jgi:hypothetical protein
MAYQMIVEDDGFVFRFRGVVTLDEVMEANREWYYRTDLDQYRYQIWDFGNVDRIDMDEFDAKVVAVLDGMPYRLDRTLQLALIGTGDDIINLFKEYASTLDNDKFDTRVFKDEPEARKWIGI